MALRKDGFGPANVTTAGTTLVNPGPFSRFPWLMGCYRSEARTEKYRRRGIERVGAGKVAFQFTLSGRGVFKDRDGEHPLPPGTCFLVQVDRPDYEYFYPAGGDDPWSFLWCDMCGGGVCDQATELNARYGHVFTLPGGQGIVAKLTRFLQKPLRTRSMEAGANSLLVAELLSALMLAGEGEKILTPMGALVREACAMIHGPDRPDNVSALADELGVSREHLARAFRKEMGRSPGEVLAEKRLEQAQLELRLSSRPIEEVALDLGYSSAAHFGAVFKQAVGITPGKYRMILQGGEPHAKPTGRRP